MRQNILIFAGILGFIAGVLFMLQGLGIVRWPVTSTMIDSQVWIIRGGVLAALSAILVGGVRLVPTRAERKAARRAAERD
jgi:cytochrome c biogenesis protein CcdA